MGDFLNCILINNHKSGRLKMKYLLKFLHNEYWYGGATEYGKDVPFGISDHFTADLRKNETANQAAPLFISNKGRFIWSEDGFLLETKDGEIQIISNGAVYIGQSGNTLADAYKEVSAKYFPSSGVMPDRLMFEMPQYCTWIELQYNQSQKGILKYAKNIIESGMPVGELIIDDNWQIDYGVWDFDTASFPSPEKMIRELKAKGFKVCLWIAPYISPDSMVFRELEQKRLLVVGADGNTAVRRWWNGFSAVLDLTNPQAVAWFESQTCYLKNKYGIDGFKLDGGDPYMYKEDDITFYPTNPNDQCRRWAELGGMYPFNEVRSCWKLGGSGITQRLCDKKHSWEKGLDRLIPCAINLGLIGHAFCCPDMIGGGSFMDFFGDIPIDEELCIRWIQASTFMPMMQFSYAVWRRLSACGRKIALRFAELRRKYGEYFVELAKRAAINGEPIIRSLEYEHPGQGFEREKNSFRIGKFLVAPILKKGEKQRKIRLPSGTWLNMLDGKKYCGITEIQCVVPREDLLYFELMEN